MKDVVIVSAARTPIGVLQGALSTVSAADLGSLVIKEALHRANISGDMVDETLFGCVLQAGKYQGIARQAAVNCGDSCRETCSCYQYDLRFWLTFCCNGYSGNQMR